MDTPSAEEITQTVQWFQDMVRKRDLLSEEMPEVQWMEPDRKRMTCRTNSTRPRLRLSVLPNDLVEHVAELVCAALVNERECTVTLERTYFTDEHGQLRKRCDISVSYERGDDESYERAERVINSAAMQLYG